MSDIEKPSSPSQAMPGADQAQGHEGPNAAFVARRRQLAKLGLGAPVLATLASRPVFAGQCLSNMMSGNLSNPNRGNCAKGWSPGGWGQPGGNVHTYSTIGAWTAIGLQYGTLKPGGKANQSADYTGGSTIGDLPGALKKDTMAANTPLRLVLNDLQIGNKTRHFVTAYFNAKLSGLSGSTFMYILTTQQVLDMAAGIIPIPLGAQGHPSDFNAFFDSTWN